MPDVVFPLALPEFFEFCLTEEDWRDPSACYSFLDDLKARVPKEDRRYDPEGRTWTIASEHVEAFNELRAEYFGPDPNQMELFSEADEM